jgi:hypothetical protein
MMKKYRIDVPKAGANNAEGVDVRLYEAGEMVEAKEDWQENLMQAFVSNGWATEIKMVEPEETTVPVEAEIKPKRGRPRKAAAKTTAKAK